MISTRRIIRHALGVCLLVGLGAVIVYYATREKPVAVAVSRVDRGRVEATVSNTRSGTVKACRRAKLAPAMGGQIVRLAVREGDVVREGEILLELWNDDLKAQVNLAEREVEAGRSAAQEACFLAAEAERDAGRLKGLREKNLLSESDYDKANTKAEATRANCNAARARAGVSEARLAASRSVLEKTILRASFGGTVAEVNGEVGEFVTPSPTGVATLPAVDLIDNSCLYVSAPIDEVDAPVIRPGMKARITLDAFPGRPFPGKVQRVAPYVLELEKQARTVEVETLFLDEEKGLGGLLPGYSADVEIILEIRDDVLRIPTEAVMDGERVLVYDTGTKRLVQRSVKAGLSNWRYTEVLSGLKEGEAVVTSVGREGVGPGVLAKPEYEAGATG
jgi:HlyD family secretion protein